MNNRTKSIATEKINEEYIRSNHELSLQYEINVESSDEDIFRGIL
jgi:hypothetical protein